MKDPCFMYGSEWTYCVCCWALIPFVVPNTQVLSSTLLAGHSVLVDLAATGIRLGRVMPLGLPGVALLPSDGLGGSQEFHQYWIW